MWLASVLLLHSGSNEGRPNFVNVGPNHTISLSSEAEAFVRTSSFLILSTGGSGNGKSFLLNNLIRGPGHDPFSKGVFEVDDGGNPVTHGFPFHAGIRLGDFCKIWGIDCDPNMANITIVFIDSQGDGALRAEHEDVLRRTLALSAIIGLRIHVTPGQRPSFPEWRKLFEGTGINVLMTGQDVTHGLAVVVPRIGVPGMTNDRTDRDYNEARREQDASFTESLHTSYRGGHGRSDNRSVVWLQPDARARSDSYWASMREIAEFIVRLARETERLPPEDAFALFECAAQWLQEQGENFGDVIPFGEILREHAIKQLRQIRKDLIEKYRDEAQWLFSHNYGAFAVDSEAESRNTVQKARSEFGRAVDRLPRPLRAVAKSSVVNSEIDELEVALTRDIPIILTAAQEKVKGEFRANCKMEYGAIVFDAKETSSLSYILDSDFEGRSLRRFSAAVDHDDLPLRMQLAVAEEYEDTRQRIREALRAEIKRARGNLCTAGGAAVTVLGALATAGAGISAVVAGPVVLAIAGGIQLLR
jgi:hypothetical protein